MNPMRARIESTGSSKDSPLGIELFLMRHGVALDMEEAGVKRDADRPLSTDGRRKTHEVARAMKAMELEFDRIISSPLLRARDTAAIVAEELKSKKRLDLSDVLKPGCDPGSVVGLLKGAMVRRVLLVGHEPDLSAVVSRFTTGGDRLNVCFKKAGLCKLTVEALRDGHCATLEWLLTPRLMLCMAAREKA